MRTIKLLFIIQLYIGIVIVIMPESKTKRLWFHCNNCQHKFLHISTPPPKNGKFIIDCKKCGVDVDYTRSDYERNYPPNAARGSVFRRLFNY